MTHENTIEKAITYLTATAPQIRRIEQQIWLNRLPYADPEHKVIVEQSHETLSEDAKVMLGLVLHYPDFVQDELNNTFADNDWGTIRTTKRTRPYNRGRTLNYIKKERGLTLRAARVVFNELAEFVGTLKEHTGTPDYHGVRPNAWIEQ
jgi:hypothetical protein